MYIYKTRLFARWARKEKIPNTALLQALAELEAGLHDGDLGKHLFKKRVRKSGQGKRGAYRTIIAVKMNHCAFFMFGYAKNEKSTLSLPEHEALKDYSKIWLDMPQQQRANAVKKGELIEVKR